MDGFALHKLGIDIERLQDEGILIEGERIAELSVPVDEGEPMKVVLEYAGAFLQLYRLEGWYLERTVHFVQRVGVDYVKRRIVDDATGRKELRRSRCRWSW